MLIKNCFGAVGCWFRDNPISFGFSFLKLPVLIHKPNAVEFAFIRSVLHGLVNENEDLALSVEPTFESIPRSTLIFQADPNVARFVKQEGLFFRRMFVVITRVWFVTIRVIQPQQPKFIAECNPPFGRPVFLRHGVARVDVVCVLSSEFVFQKSVYCLFSFQQMLNCCSAVWAGFVHDCTAPFSALAKGLDSK